MAYRGRRLSLPDHRHVLNNMDRLAFKYMEKCKVESSTDSDSEISPRWSDTSTMGCVSSTPESRTSRRTLPLTYKPTGRHGCYSLFLDPYDGSSEDSDESNIDASVSSRRMRQQGKGGGGGSCRFLGRSRRFFLHHPAPVVLREVVKNGMRDPVTQQQHLLDVQMKCESDSELCVCDIMPSHNNRALTEEMTSDPTVHTQTMDIDLDCQFDDSGLQTTRHSTTHTPGPITPVEESLPLMLDQSCERSPCTCILRSLKKRKLGFAGAEAVELRQSKRLCVVNMEDEEEERDSAPEPC